MVGTGWTGYRARVFSRAPFSLSNRLRAAWLSLLAGAVLLVGAAPVAAQVPDPAALDRLEAELVPMSTWATPGATVIVAVRQKIAPGWHTYWRNPGDSGGATTLDWTLPSGVEAEPILWPLPQRQRLQSLMNYGYSDTVYLPVPIRIPSGARPGSTLPLSVQALFLVCSDQMCVPDQRTLTLDLPVSEGAAPLAGADGRRIQTVIETAPRPAGIEARVTRNGSTLTLSATGGPLAGADLSRATFFPFEGAVIDHAAPQFGRLGPQGLTLELAAAPAGKGVSLEAKPISGVLATDAGAWEITATPGPPLVGAAGCKALEASEDAPPAPGWSPILLLQTAGLALLGGLILNLMPCVFPVLAMKAAALTRTAHDPAEARRDGFAFLAGVLTTFAALAIVLLAVRAGGQAIGWGFQLQSPAVVAVLALLMLAVALNLSGLFEIGVRLQNLGSGPLSRLHGGAGAFLTGVLAVVVAAPCTAPFMASALGAALLLPAPAAVLVFLMLGLGLALPYLAISLSPRVLALLPRPGPWMAKLQRLLALPMYAAALWLVWVFARQTGTLPLILLVCAGLAVVLGLWAFGRPAAKPMRAIAIAALIAALALTGLAVRTAGSAPQATEIQPDAWSEARVAEALAQGRPVLVNFTADWCVTCKINERSALGSPAVAKALERTNTLYLKADWTRRDDAITRALQRHGRSGVPLYLLYAPGQPEPRILPQLLTEGLVVEALKRTP